MSKIGMRHLSQNPAHYSGLAFGKGALTSSTSPLWSPMGAYNMPSGNFGGFYGEADGTQTAAATATAPAPEKSSELMDFLKSPLGLLLLAGGGYLIYKNMGGTKKTSNPRRRRRNGTKKGMRRKTARRAYMKKNAVKVNRRRKNGVTLKKNSAAQKRAQKNAAKAMKLWKSGKASSLKAAWRQVKAQ